MIVSLERRKATAYHVSLFELLSWEVRKNPRTHIILVEKVEEFLSSQHNNIYVFQQLYQITIIFNTTNIVFKGKSILLVIGI